MRRPFAFALWTEERLRHARASARVLRRVLPTLACRCAWLLVICDSQAAVGPTRGAVIVLPAGYLLSLRKYSWDQGQDAESMEVRKLYRAVVRKAFEAMNESLALGENFDFTVDDGRRIKGCRRVIRIGN